MGKRRRHARQKTMWVASTDLPQSAGHPFYERLNRVLDDASFDAFVEAQCAKFYTDGVGRPSVAPGALFPAAAARLLRGSGLGARDRVARRRLAEHPASFWTLSCPSRRRTIRRCRVPGA